MAPTTASKEGPWRGLGVPGGSLGSPGTPGTPRGPPKNSPRPSPEIMRAVLAALVELRFVNSRAASSHQPAASSHRPAAGSEQQNLGGCSSSLGPTAIQEQPRRSPWVSLSTQTGLAEWAERINKLFTKLSLGGHPNQDVKKSSAENKKY